MQRIVASAISARIVCWMRSSVAWSRLAVDSSRMRMLDDWSLRIPRARARSCRWPAGRGTRSSEWHKGVGRKAQRTSREVFAALGDLHVETLDDITLRLLRRSRLGLGALLVARRRACDAALPRRRLGRDTADARRRHLHAAQRVPHVAVAVLRERVEVEPQGALKERRLLRDDRQALAQVLEPERIDVESVDGNAPTPRLDEPEEAECERRLARAGAPDNADLLAALDGERDILEDIGEAWRVRRREVLDLDGRAARRPDRGRLDPSLVLLLELKVCRSCLLVSLALLPRRRSSEQRTLLHAFDRVGLHLELRPQPRSPERAVGERHRERHDEARKRGVHVAREDYEQRRDERDGAGSGVDAEREPAVDSPCGRRAQLRLVKVSVRRAHRG